MADLDWGFEGPFQALVLGARGGIGEAFVQALLLSEQVQRVLQTSRSEAWCADSVTDKREKRVCLDLLDSTAISGLGRVLEEEPAGVQLVINCTGILHGEGLRPERTWAQIEREAMQHAFQVHATGLALVLQTVMPHIPRDKRAVFASLSARIGSIEDNRLGGWFSYRASKAAQNMILKTASVEAARRWPKLAVVALHPGTVHSDLSAPFAGKLPPSKVFSPEKSVSHLQAILKRLSAKDTGSFWAWDGTSIPW